MEIKTRLRSLDAGRLVMVLAVAVLHALPTPYRPGAPSWAVITAIPCRGAVPYFLILGGYFLRPEHQSFGKSVTRPFERLLPLYLAWFAIYAFVVWLRTNVLHLAIADLFTGGAGLHLWFIPVIAFALCSVGGGARLIGLASTFGLCVLLAIGSLTIGSYHELLGLSALPAQRILAAPIYVAVGLYLARANFNPPTVKCLIFTIATFACLLGEELMISRVSGQRLISHDFIISTFFFGISLFLLVKSFDVGKYGRRLANLGRLAFGVYGSHLLFVWLISSKLGNGTVGICVIVGSAAFALALAVSWILAKVPYASRLVLR